MPLSYVHVCVSQVASRPFYPPTPTILIYPYVPCAVCGKYNDEKKTAVTPTVMEHTV